MPSAKSLDAFPRPNVAVDLAVLTVQPSSSTRDPLGELCVLVFEPTRASRRRALPGRFVRERRTTHDTVNEILEDKLGIDPGSVVTPQLLGVFDDPNRDDRGWTMSLAHAVALPIDRLSGSRGDLVPVDRNHRLSTHERLDYDHDAIVEAAVRRMREQYSRAPDPYRLVEEPFTLSELRRFHEAVLGARLVKDTFNRRMQPHFEAVTDVTGAPVVSRSIGRPAQLYRRRRPARRRPRPAAR